MVTPGRYRHDKGGEYEVIGCARHSETEEDFVVYRALYGERGLWVDPRRCSWSRSWLRGGACPALRSSSPPASPALAAPRHGGAVPASPAVPFPAPGGPTLNPSAKGLS